MTAPNEKATTNVYESLSDEELKTEIAEINKVQQDRWKKKIDAVLQQKFFFRNTPNYKELWVIRNYDLKLDAYRCGVITLHLDNVITIDPRRSMLYGFIQELGLEGITRERFHNLFNDAKQEAFLDMLGE